MKSNDKLKNGRKIYADINNIFSRYNNSSIKDLVQAKKFNIGLGDLNKFYNKEICSKNDFDEYVLSTLELFRKNYAKGKKQLVSLQSVLRQNLIVEPFKKTGNMRNMIEYGFQDVEAKYNIFAWIVLADHFPENQFYNNGLVVIPFESCQYPWYNTRTKKLNMKAFNYSYPLDIATTKDLKYEDFNGKWQLNKDYSYARDVIKKYIFKDKKIVFDKFREFYISGFNTFTLGYTSNGKIIYIGDTKTYLKLHKEYIES